MRAILLALVVHALFFGLIVVGVSWQSSPSPPVVAELWDKLPPAPKAAPPKPEPPKPEPPKPEPPKPEPPKPEPPKPEPPKPEPPKPEAKPEPAQPDPEIALKAERERLEREKRKQEELRKKREAEAAAQKKREEEAAARKQRELEEAARKKREQEEAAKRKREQEEKRRAEEKRRREEEAARRAAEQARAAAEEARLKEFNRYVNAIRARIRGRANVPDTVTGRPNVQVEIRILPGGDVLDIRVVKSSGNRTYDTAIERAIRSAQPLPVPPPDSELFPQFRDLILNIEHER